MYLFFVRHFNDIDHLTPIVWKLNSADYTVAVYCMNPLYDIRNDYRLQFLKSQGVAVKSLYETHDREGNVIYRIIHAVFQKSAEFQTDLGPERRGQSGMPAKLMMRLAGRLRSMTFKLLRRWYYDASWARIFLKRTGAQVVCFDHVMPKHYVVDALLKASCRLSIHSLALPHGVHLYTNDSTKAKATDERRIAKFNRFDYVIVTNELRRSLLVRAGVEADKIFILGSARYCSEWLELNSNILPGGFNGVNAKTGQLKVVLMPSKPQCKMDVDRLFNTCRILADLEGVEAMIKPHTRTHSHKYGFDKNPLPDVSNVLTAELCEWADVILNVGSSVITEALMRNKPALYLKYLHTNITRFEELGACWTIHDETELKTAMSTLQADKNYMPYSQENVAAFLSEIVYGGNPNRDVLTAYAQFIADCANPKQMEKHRKLTKRILAGLITEAKRRKISQYLKDRSRTSMIRQVSQEDESHLDDILRIALKHITPVTAPLALISHIQHVGGSFLNRLFDGHPEIHALPFELKAAKLYSGLQSEFDLDHQQDDWVKSLSKDTTGIQQSIDYADQDGTSLPFLFLTLVQEQIFLKRLGSAEIKKKRDVYEAYITACFGAWLDYQNCSGEKLFTTACVRAPAMQQECMDGFFEIYPDGRLIYLVQDPQSWCRAASKADPDAYADLKGSVARWNDNLLSALRTKERFADQTCLIKVEDLVDKPERIMRHLAEFLGLQYNPMLLTPTFNGYPVAAVCGIDYFEAIKPHPEKVSDLSKDLSKMISEMTQKNYLTALKQTVSA